MGLIAKDTGGGGYAPIEAGTYLARCVGVVDLGIQHNDFNNKDQEKVRLIWELPTERTEVDGEDKPRWMSKPYTLSLHEKATLRKDLDAWRGRAFTPEELAGFNLKNVIAAPCLLTIIREKGKNGNEYAKVSAVGKVMKGMNVAPLENTPIVFDMDSPDAPMILTQLPQWIQDEVKRSVTWNARMGTFGGDEGFTPVGDDDVYGGEDVPF